jgi:hypothetical protein
MRFWGRLLREYFWHLRSLTCCLLTMFRYCAVLVVFMGNMPD